MLSVVLFAPSSQPFAEIHLSQATAWFSPDSVGWITARKEPCTYSFGLIKVLSTDCPASTEVNNSLLEAQARRATWVCFALVKTWQKPWKRTKCGCILVFITVLRETWLKMVSLSAKHAERKLLWKGSSLCIGIFVLYLFLPFNLIYFYIFIYLIH